MLAVGSLVLHHGHLRATPGVGSGERLSGLKPLEDGSIQVVAKRTGKKTTKTKKTRKKPIQSYDHKDKKRANDPPVELVTPEPDPYAGQKKPNEYDPYLDPQLVWADKMATRIWVWAGAVGACGIQSGPRRR